MLELHNISEPNLGESRLDARTLAFTHPDDVLRSATLTVDDKRALLATWASDAHAAPNVPSMRQLDSGAIISLDVILSSLQALDDIERARQTASQTARTAVRKPGIVLWRSSRRRDDQDDDDPPPCPASAALPLPRRIVPDHFDAMRGLIAA